MRKVDLLNYTDFNTIGKAREFYERVKAENPEFMLLYDEFVSTIKNTLILEADEDGIRRYEKILGLLPVGDLEERRRAVYMRWNSITIWTDRTLRAYLNGLLGKRNYKLEFLYDAYSIKVKLMYGNRRFGTVELIDNLREIIPANIWLLMTWEVDCNQFLGVYRHYSKAIKMGIAGIKNLSGLAEGYVGLSIPKVYKKIIIYEKR